MATMSATYRANAEKEGFSWVWDAKVGRYKLTGSKGLIGWFRSLARVRGEIAEVRFVAKGNFCKFLRDLGYRKAWQWTGDTRKSLVVEFRGAYMGTYKTLEEAEAAAKEHEYNRWN